MDDALNNEFMENTIDFGYLKEKKKFKKKSQVIGGLKLPIKK